jgi:hypothetical protein
MAFSSPARVNTLETVAGGTMGRLFIQRFTIGNAAWTEAACGISCGETVHERNAHGSIRQRQIQLIRSKLFNW